MSEPRNNPIDITNYCIRRVLREVLNELGYNNVEIVESSSRGLEPKDSYLVFDLPDFQEVGRSEKSSYLLEDKASYHKNSYKAFLQLSSVGSDSRNIIGDISSRIPTSNSIRAAFRKWGFSVLNTTGVRRNPQLRESEWVDTYNVGINLTFSYYFKENSDWFELVTTNGFEFSIADR